MKMFYQQIGKRFFDVVVIVLAMLLLSPILLITSFFVRRKLGFPILFSQDRPGLHSKTFTLLKFRTMTDERDSNGELLPDEDRLSLTSGSRRWGDPAAALQIAAVAGPHVSNFTDLDALRLEPDVCLRLVERPEELGQPDVVLLRSFMADSLGRSLEQLEIPVVYLDLETPEQYFRDVDVLGQLLGDAARAEAVQDYYRTRLDRVEQAVGEVADEKRPRVLLVQYSQQGGEVAFNVPSATWLQTTEVELAGGAPVWKEAAPGDLVSGKSPGGQFQNGQYGFAIDALDFGLRIHQVEGKLSGAAVENGIERRFVC